MLNEGELRFLERVSGQLDETLVILRRHEQQRAEAANLLYDALATDGAHHKQWYLFKIADVMEIALPENDYEQGIAP